MGKRKCFGRDETALKMKKWKVGFLTAVSVLVGCLALAVSTEASECQQYDFGHSNLQAYVYSDGRTWNFTAEQDMNVQLVEVKSVLGSYGGTFHIQVKINDALVASWDQSASGGYMTTYTNSANVALDLHVGDTITYRIYGGTSSSPVGSISGPNYVKLCTGTVALSAPTLSVTTVGTGLTLTWSTVSGATGYTLCYAPYPYTGPDSIGSIDMGIQTAFSTNLWEGAAFYVAVQAYDGAESSGYSNIEYFIIDGTAPSIPTNLAASAVSSSQIDLSWDASTDNVGVAGYNIYRDGELVASSTDSLLMTDRSTVYETQNIESARDEVSIDGAFSESRSIRTTAVTGTSFSDSGLSQNTLYCYSISAYDASGNESGQSSQACATTSEDATCEGGGLPLVLSDLDFKDTVAGNSGQSGSVAYQGGFKDIANPVMALRLYTKTSTITTYVTSSSATANNCRINFLVGVPDVSGTGTVSFRLVDYVSGQGNNWENNAVSNIISKTVTIN
jgi:chitodextrinase